MARKKFTPEDLTALSTAVVLLFWPRSPATPKENAAPGEGVGVWDDDGVAVGIGVGVGEGVGIGDGDGVGVEPWLITSSTGLGGLRGVEAVVIATGGLDGQRHR